MPTDQVPQAAAEPQDAFVRRLSVLVLSIGACAGLFALVVPFWTSARGVVGPTVASSERPWLAAGLAVAALAAATIVSILVARAVNAVVGTFVLGCGVGMLAMRTGAVQDFVFGEPRLWPLAIETLGWAALIAGACFAIYRFGGRLPDYPVTGEDEVDAPAGREARRAWIAGAAAPVAAWFVAVNDLKGQAVAAALIGGFLAAFIARSVSRRTQPVFVAAAVAAAFALVQGYIAFAITGDLAGGLVDGSLPRLLRLMPVDIAAGALCGTAIGFGFARSFVGPATD